MNSNNGRVDLLYGKNYNIYNLFNEPKKEYKNFKEEAIKNIHSDNELSELFLSSVNVDILQDAIIGLVYEKSKHKYVIDRQSDTELRIIMRSIYLEHGRHKIYGTIDEVKRLNGLVLQFAVPRIMQEIQLYMTYKNDVDKIPEPLSRGDFISAKGSRTLIQKEF
jgi:hypothetical protein